ncbi:hypothetical protein [Sporisorium scitamineum]|uniref:Uncharacterized protein n=1 Tax=Sporisorium scitamineum TaxID=49012 RepID=A0A0F7SC61_9BASI|nr:hypothetical protein [Sporisorium scitamineum]
MPPGVAKYILGYAFKDLIDPITAPMPTVVPQNDADVATAGTAFKV